MRSGSLETGPADQLGVFVRARSRRYVATLSLLHYLALLVGIPLPMPAAKDSSRPFPCQHHRCGCQNAEQCWKHCCCFTNEQKLAWARANGVTPTVDLLADNPEEHEHDDHDHVVAAGSCHARECCSHREKDRPAHVPTADDRGQRSIAGLDAARCHGNSLLFVALNLHVTPLSALVWADDRTPHEWLSMSDSKAFGVVRLIEPPPPKA
jgi:hypothetical protein